MSEVTAEDLKRVYDKMEKSNEKLDIKLDQTRAEFVQITTNINNALGQISTSVAVMAERFKGMGNKVDDVCDGIPVLPERPCKHFEDHLEAHKSVKKPIITGIIVAAFLFVHEPIKIFIAGMFSKP